LAQGKIRELDATARLRNDCRAKIRLNIAADAGPEIQVRRLLWNC
jgi:hypothetical protein